MSLLASLRAIDIEPTATAGDYASYRLREAGRLIAFDGPRVALLYVRKHDYYMLPGGGLDGEEIGLALKREAMEELGRVIELDREVGAIEVYLDRWRNRQVDHCYTAHIVGAPSTISPTDFEQEEGHEIVWANSIEAAIQFVATAIPDEIDGQLIRARDLLFLQTALANLQ